MHATETGRTLPATQDGMGAIAHHTGTTFRVWAPHADAVKVVGSFSHWSDVGCPLEPEGGGFWAGDVPGARPGHEYKFLIENGDRVLWRTDPYARDVTSSVGNGVIRSCEFYWQDQSFRTPDWNDLVIYELHLGTFHDEPGGAPGDLSSAILKLPLLAELGVTAVEIMPHMEFAGGFSWGYNPAHIFAVESDYGESSDLKRFVDAAHALGIAVIFDVVYNHFGPSDLDLWQFDGWEENGKGGIYFYGDHRSKTPWGDTRPDYGRPEVRQFLRDNALWWLEEYRIDGLRWDATAYIRSVDGSGGGWNSIPDGWSLVQWINDEIKARQPWKISIAEDLRDEAAIVRPTLFGGAGFDTQWDSKFVHPVREALTAIDDGERSMFALRDAIYHRYDGDAFERVVYTESHDEVANGKARVPEEIWPGHAESWASKKRSTLGAALVMTTPGIPMLFQGQEFLEDQWFHDQDPVDWNRRQRFAGIVQLYTDLIHLRRNRSGTTSGLMGQHVDVHHINDHDKVIAFHRYDQGGPGDSVIVCLNFGHRAYPVYNLGLPREGWWKVRFNSDWSGYDAEFGDQSSFDVLAHRGWKDGMEWNGSVGLGAYSAVILSQDG